MEGIAFIHPEQLGLTEAELLAIRREAEQLADDYSYERMACDRPSSAGAIAMRTAALCWHLLNARP
jgi:hypothetical protein